MGKALQTLQAASHFRSSRVNCHIRLMKSSQQLLITLTWIFNSTSASMRCLNLVATGEMLNFGGGKIKFMSISDKLCSSFFPEKGRTTGTMKDGMDGKCFLPT